MIRKETKQFSTGMAPYKNTVPTNPSTINTIRPQGILKTTTPVTTNLNSSNPVPKPAITNPVSQLSIKNVAPQPIVKSIVPQAAIKNISPQILSSTKTSTQPTIKQDTLQAAGKTEAPQSAARNVPLKSNDGGVVSLTPDSKVKEDNGDTKMTEQASVDNTIKKVDGAESDGKTHEPVEKQGELCPVCKIMLYTVKTAIQHMNGSKHRKKQALMEKLNVVQKLKSVGGGKQKPATAEELSAGDIAKLLYCDLCRCEMNSPDHVKFHTMGKRHQRNLANAGDKAANPIRFLPASGGPKDSAPPTTGSYSMPARGRGRGSSGIAAGGGRGGSTTVKEGSSGASSSTRGGARGGGRGGTVIRGGRGGGAGGQYSGGRGRGAPTARGGRGGVGQSSFKPRGGGAAMGPPSNYAQRGAALSFHSKPSLGGSGVGGYQGGVQSSPQQNNLRFVDYSREQNTRLMSPNQYGGGSGQNPRYVSPTKPAGSMGMRLPAAPGNPFRSQGSNDYPNPNSQQYPGVMKQQQVQGYDMQQQSFGQGSQLQTSQEYHDYMPASHVSSSDQTAYYNQYDTDYQQQLQNIQGGFQSEYSNPQINYKEAAYSSDTYPSENMTIGGSQQNYYESQVQCSGYGTY